MEIYKSEGYVDVKYNEELKSLLVNWKFFGNEVRNSCQAQLDFIKTNEVKSIIVDTSEATGIVKASDQIWFYNYLFPEFEKNGIETIVTITSKDALTRLSNKTWSNTGKSFAIKFIETPSVESAISKLKKYIHNLAVVL